MTRRELLLGMPAFLRRRQRRVIVFMIDGFGPDYLAASRMPVLNSWQRAGISKLVEDVMPSVTNPNNTSICCGAWPEEHGGTQHGIRQAAVSNRGLQLCLTAKIGQSRIHTWVGHTNVHDALYARITRRAQECDRPHVLAKSLGARGGTNPVDRSFQFLPIRF